MVEVTSRATVRKSVNLPLLVRYRTCVLVPIVSLLLHALWMDGAVMFLPLFAFFSAITVHKLMSFRNKEPTQAYHHHCEKSV